MLRNTVGDEIRGGKLVDGQVGEREGRCFRKDSWRLRQLSDEEKTEGKGKRDGTRPEKKSRQTRYQLGRSWNALMCSIGGHIPGFSSDITNPPQSFGFGFQKGRMTSPIPLVNPLLLLQFRPHSDGGERKQRSLHICSMLCSIASLLHMVSKKGATLSSYLANASALRTQPMMFPRWGTLLT